jgi:hypothetical protein
MALSFPTIQPYSCLRRRIERLAPLLSRCNQRKASPTWKAIAPAIAKHRRNERMKEYILAESQIDNIIDVLETWKKVLETFIENFIIMKQQQER